MELSLSTYLIILGVLIVIAVLVDGLRKIYNPNNIVLKSKPIDLSNSVGIDANNKHNDQNNVGDISSEVFAILLSSQDDDIFVGAKLVESLINNGLRINQEGQFEQVIKNEITNLEEVAFIVINGIKPGTFDMEKLNNIYTPLIIFYFVAPPTIQVKKNFTLMLNKARIISANMGGILLDDKNQDLTIDNLDKYMQRIQRFENKMDNRFYR